MMETSLNITISLRPVIQSAQVPPESCVRKMDQGAFVSDNGLSIAPGNPLDPIEVAHCREWIKVFARPRKTINPFAFSYELKHIVENWRSGLPTDSKYVSNGAFIWAAVLENYRFLWDVPGPNCYLNMRFRWNRKTRGGRYEYNWDEPYLPFHEKAR